MYAISKLSIAAVFAFTAAASAVAQDTGHGAHGTHAAQGARCAQSGQEAHPGCKADVAAEMVDGEIKKVDKEAGKITIRHGELKALDMPAMTMVFRAKDSAMLSQVKVGDKVTFMAEKINGALTVVHMENTK